METPAFSSAAFGPSIAGISELLNLPGSSDPLDDVDFETTMMMFDNPEAAGAHAVMTRRHSVEPLDFSLTNLVDLFSHDSEMPEIKSEPQSLPSSSYLSPDPKLRAGGRPSLAVQEPAGGAAIKSEHGVAAIKSEHGVAAIKHEHGSAPELSPIMDSFLQETWDDIAVDGDGGARSARSSWKSQAIPSTSSTNSTAASLPVRITPLPHSFILPGASSASKPVGAAIKSVGHSSATKKPPVQAARSTEPPAPKQPKASRRAKQCVAEGCIRRAQSNNRCKTHGGGARCQMPGCDKSSQGGGLCRAHGGGKKCRVSGCTKGTQRLGLCYLHGGIRRCITEGCKKKDRGNGYCISHGGGRRCEVTGCDRSVRKGNRCQTHQTGEEDRDFQITRGQGLAFP